MAAKIMCLYYGLNSLQKTGILDIPSGVGGGGGSAAQRGERLMLLVISPSVTPGLISAASG